jgi:hypothetical protein
MEHDLSIKARVDARLLRIANVLIINSSFTDNIGLLNGKMGIAIFFYQYSRYTLNKIYEDYAGELIDEIYEEINTNIPVDFANGLTGIGWGIEYLVKNGFLEADTDEALAEFDSYIYKHRLNKPILINSGDDLFGYGFYHIARLQCHKIDDNDLNTLIKKYHLIFLTDECERILEQKLYANFNIEALSINTLNSFIWFLIEMSKLRIFPYKVDKIFRCAPEYIEKGFQDSSDEVGLTLLVQLTEHAIRTVEDQRIKKLLLDILVKKNEGMSVVDSSEETKVSNFIKYAWQQLIYAPYSMDGKEIPLNSVEIFPILSDEKRWNKILENLNKDNLGLTGFAGLGLGLLGEYLFSLGEDGDHKERISNQRVKSSTSGVKINNTNIKI